MEPEKAKLLVVDDEPEIVNAIKDFLSLKGYAVTGAFSGEQALGILEKERADLVLLDLRMPGIKGTEVAKIVKKKYPYIKVIILTGYIDEAEGLSTDNVLEDILVKPVKLGELNNRLTEILKPKESSIPDLQSKEGIKARVLTINAKLLFMEPSTEVYNFLHGYFCSLSKNGENYELDVVHNEEKIMEKLILFKPDLLVINVSFLKGCSIEILMKILDNNFNLKEILIYNIKDGGLLLNNELERLVKSVKTFCFKNGLLEIKWVEI